MTEEEILKLKEKASAHASFTSPMLIVEPSNILWLLEQLESAEAKLALVREQRDSELTRNAELEAKLAAQCAEVCKANALIDDLRAERDLLQRLAGERGNNLDVAEAKLAEIAKQEPVDYLTAMAAHHSNEWHKMGPITGYMEGWNDCLAETRPAPAADLAELVPDGLTRKQASRSYGGEVVGYRDGWNDCRAAILRNIEEAK